MTVAAVEKWKANFIKKGVIKGNVAAAVASPVHDTSDRDQKAKKAYLALRPRVVTTLKQYQRKDSIAKPVAAFIKRLNKANQVAKDGAYADARDLISALNGELIALSGLERDERNAETDCRTRLKELTDQLKQYQQLDTKSQDKALLKLVDGEFKAIQALMDKSSYDSALKRIEPMIKRVREARLAVTWGDGGMVGEDAKKRLPKMIRVAVEREEVAAAKDLEVRVQSETLGAALGDPKIRDLMIAHRNFLPREVKAFKGYRWLDDVLAVKNVKHRKKDLLAIDHAIQFAQERQTQMFGLLRGVKSPPVDAATLAEAQVFARGMTNHIPDKWQVEGRGLAQRLPMLLKDKDERAAAKKEAMDIPQKTRDQETALFKEVIEHGSLKGVDRTQFYFDEPLLAIGRDSMDERALAKVKEANDLLKEYQQLDPLLQDAGFISDILKKISDADKGAKDGQSKLKKKRTSDTPDPDIAKLLGQSTEISEGAIRELREAIDEAGGTAQTPDSGSQYERLMKTFDKIIQRAYKVHDAGGSVSEVESTMQHVPPEFWPPQFIENLQAWRKVERELAEERVEALFKNEKFGFGDAKECLALAMGTLGTLGATSGLDQQININESHDLDAKGWMNAPDVAKLIEGYINTIRSGFDLGPEYAKAMESLDYSSVKTDQLSTLYDKVADTTRTFIGVVTNFKHAGIPPKSVFVAEVIPVLSAIAAGIDLTVSLNALRKAITMRVKTGRMIGKANLEYFSGEMRDGGALVKAIKNERDARNRQVDKKSTDVAAKSVTLAGEATKAAVGAGLGTEQAVGYGLVVAGKAIEYGGKIVFAGIDWGIAKQAKKLIKEAQAGNPIARMELMENSGLYAKMYIAILAKEGHKLALIFIDQRGYDERAVMKPAVSMKILREAMLSHADQKDETQVSGNLGVAITEGVTGKGPVKAVKMGGKAVAKGAAALAKKVKDLPKDKKIPYDATWKPKGPVSMAPVDWKANKKDCIKSAGLYSESTGIDKALKPCDGAVKEADDAITTYTMAQNISSDDREKLIKLVRKTQGTLLDAMDTIADYYPGSNDGALHQPMTDYLVGLRRVLGTHSNMLDQRLADIKLINTAWAPARTPGTSADDWEENWADAVKQCDLPKKDGGVSKALHAFEDAHLTLAQLDYDEFKLTRETRVEIRDRLRDAGVAVKKLWPACTSLPGMTTYLDKMIDYVIKVSQNNDQALNGFDWKDNPAKDFASNPATFTSLTWKTTYTAADKEGFVNRKAKDCGMEEALAGWEKHIMAKDAGAIKKKVDPKDLPKKRKEATKLVAEVAKAAESLAAANPDSHTEFLKYIAWLRRMAHEKVAEFGRAQDETFFTPTLGLDKISWKKTYDAGLATGGIPKNDTAFKELEKPLDAYGKAVVSMLKAKNSKKFKNAFSDALKARAKTAEIQKVLTHVEGTEGWSNHCLDEYFTFVRNQAQYEPESGEVGKMLKGATASFEEAKFTFENKSGWQEVKKKAIDAGVIADAKTGFGKTIEDYHKAVVNRDEAKKKESEKPDVYKKTYEIVNNRLVRLEGVAKRLKGQTENKKFIAYFHDAEKQSRAKQRSLEKNRPG